MRLIVRFPLREKGEKMGEMITASDRDVFMLTKIQRRFTENKPFFTTGKNMNLTRDIISIIMEIIIRPEHKAA
jgi:hypothetical protein